MFHTYLLVAVCIPLASASIFPTQPVQATVWSADQPMLVSWVDDWKYPMLDQMGPLDISLWRDTDTYLVQLASSVDPTTKTRQVTVPGRALKQGSKYTLRFTTHGPVNVVVYSADFAIVPEGNITTGVMNAATGTGTGTGDNGAVWTQSGAGVGTGSGFRTVPTTTGSWSTLTATTTTTSASGQYGSTAPSGTPPPLGTIAGGGLPEAQRAASAGRRGVDVEKLKFRFVFVIWPVLMGVAMAL